jgi:hypothetical protein
MRRVEQWFLGFPGPFVPRTDDEYQPVELVQVVPAVRTALSHRVAALGRWQGGALFGELVAGSLTVQAAAPACPPGDQYSPLHIHLPYLLGWSDGLAAHLSTRVDWYGNWIAAPDGRLPAVQTDLDWLAMGALQGLFDDQHILMMLGHEDGVLLGRAYRWDEGIPTCLDCRLGRLPDTL